MVELLKGCITKTDKTVYISDRGGSDDGSTKTQNRRMMLRHGGAPLVAQSGVGMQVVYS